MVTLLIKFHSYFFQSSKNVVHTLLYKIKYILYLNVFTKFLLNLIIKLTLLQFSLLLLFERGCLFANLLGVLFLKKSKL